MASVVDIEVDAALAPLVDEMRRGGVVRLVENGRPVAEVRATVTGDNLGEDTMDHQLDRLEAIRSRMPRVAADWTTAIHDLRDSGY